MDLIVTHEAADLDALGAAVAAQKLYPGARIALGASVSRSVRDFLALHKDRFQTVDLRDVDQDAVDRVIVVDVRRAGRLRGLGRLLERIERGDPALEVHVYDHHGPAEDDLKGTLDVVEPVGSATTLLVERLVARRIAVDAVEATLLALGIHADTGSFTFFATTARDVRAVAWLLERGASMAAIEHYLRPTMNAEQRRVLAHVLTHTQAHAIGGVDVGIAVLHDEPEYVEIADLTSLSLALFGYGALFVLHETPRSVDVVGRARPGGVDVGTVLRELAGGGHGAAGSARVKGQTAARVRETLLDALRAHPPTARRVRELMSAPVHVVDPDLPLEGLEEALLAWAHTGAPVARDGVLLGIVTTSDIERAERDGRLDLPVSSCMAQHVRTTGPEEPIEHALALMEKAGVGRLPVLDEAGRLVGIVTRSDIRRVLYTP